MAVVARVMILREEVSFKPLSRNGEPVVCDGYAIACRTDKPVYLDVSTDEKMGAVALSVLMGRFGRDDYFAAPPAEPEPCSVTKEEFEAISPHDPLYEGLKREVDASAEANREYQNAVRDHNALIACIADEDVRLAPAILERRCRLPNEGFEIVYLYDSYPMP